MFVFLDSVVGFGVPFSFSAFCRFCGREVEALRSVVDAFAHGNLRAMVSGQSSVVGGLSGWKMLKAEKAMNATTKSCMHDQTPLAL